MELLGGTFSEIRLRPPRSTISVVMGLFSGTVFVRQKLVSQMGFAGIFFEFRGRPCKGATSIAIGARMQNEKEHIRRHQVPSRERKSPDYIKREH